MSVVLQSGEKPKSEPKQTFSATKKGQEQIVEMSQNTVVLWPGAMEQKKTSASEPWEERRNNAW